MIVVVNTVESAGLSPGSNKAKISERENIVSYRKAVIYEEITEVS